MLGKSNLVIKILLVVGLVALLISANWVALKSRQVQTLTLASGDQEGESYILSQAIAQVVEANVPGLHITVVPTTGSDENLRQLEAGQVDLAITQADVPAGSSARTIAVLFRDLFQLFVSSSSGIGQFTDLAGRKILLQPNSGEFYSFMELATHYGFAIEDFHLLFASGEAADRLFDRGEADALFRVRTLNNDYVSRMVRQAHAQLLPLEQAEALKIQHPALEAASIPKGAYQGYPPIPSTTLPTIAVQRLLLAHRDLNRNIVRQLTQILGEHRREIAAAIPEEHAGLRSLVTTIKRPNPTAGTGIPQHAGAIAYYEQEQPSWIGAAFLFLSKNAALLIAVTTLPAGSLIGLWEWGQRLRQTADDKRLLADQLIEAVLQTLVVEPDLDLTVTQARLNASRTQLEHLFNQAANAVAHEQITQSAFHTINETYQMAQDILLQRLEQLDQKQTAFFLKDLLSAPPDDLPAVLQTIQQAVLNEHLSGESFSLLMTAYRSLPGSKRYDNTVSEAKSPDT